MTRPQNRQTLPFGHMIVETLDDPRGGTTFAFYANEAAKEKKKPAFSGHIQNGMGDQLRLIASMFDYLEKGL